MTFATKSMLIKGNLKESGEIEQSLTFFNSQLSYGTWCLYVQSIGVKFNQQVRSFVTIVSTNICSAHIETFPGNIQVEEAPLLQIELVGNKGKEKLIYQNNSFDLALPINSYAPNIVFSFKHAFTNKKIELDVDVSIVLLYKRIA